MGSASSKPKRLLYIMPHSEPEEESGEELASVPPKNFNQLTLEKFLDEMICEIHKVITNLNLMQTR